MLFNESEIIEKFKTNPIKNWEEMYQKSLFFDEAKPRDKFLPEIIFDDSKTQSYSRLRAYFSEGNALNRADSDFVNTAYRSIFSDPGNSLRVFKTSQFVATHPRVIQKLTEAFSSSEFEEAFMVVDGHFSAENYSAFPYLILSRPNDQAFVPWTRAVDMNPLDLKRKEQIANSMFSFDGSEGIYGGREGVKLHAKVSYMEYVDSRGVRHYVVIHGSANLSVNAGKGNADGLIVFDTTDPSLKKIIDPYFEGLKNNPRTKPFVETYLQKRMAHLIKYNASASKELLEHGFESSRLPKIIEDNYKLLNINDGKLTHEFAKLLKGEMALDSERSFLIEVIETITKESNQSAYSKNVLKLLRYYSQLDTRLRLEQLEQMLYLANPQNHPYEGFIKRVKVEWLKRVNQNQKAELESLFDKVILEMARFQNGSESINLKPTVREIYNNCNIHFKNLGLSDYLRVKPKADK